MSKNSQARTASAVTRMFFEALDASGISQTKVADKSGAHVNTFYGWKTGKTAATVINMEAALSVLGLELVIRPIRKSEPEEQPSR